MPISDDAIFLKVENLCTGYGKRQVLFDVSFEVRRGEILLLTGGNGSGKSTALKAIYGLLSNYVGRKGKITFLGEDITDGEPHRMIKKGIVYVPQKKNTFEHLSVKENLEVVATHVRNRSDAHTRVSKVFEVLPQLTLLKNRKPFYLSGGEKQQLALGMALIQQPAMILLDEPGAGLSPKMWQRSLEVISTLNRRGISFLIVEHRVKETIDKVHNVIRMNLGRIEG